MTTSAKRWWKTSMAPVICQDAEICITKSAKTGAALEWIITSKELLGLLQLMVLLWKTIFKEWHGQPKWQRSTHLRWCFMRLAATSMPV